MLCVVNTECVVVVCVKRISRKSLAREMTRMVANYEEFFLPSSKTSTIVTEFSHVGKSAENAPFYWKVPEVYEGAVKSLLQTVNLKIFVQTNRHLANI